jgi:hypothetical protein
MNLKKQLGWSLLAAAAWAWSSTGALAHPGGGHMAQEGQQGSMGRGMQHGRMGHGMQHGGMQGGAAAGSENPSSAGCPMMGTAGATGGCVHGNARAGATGQAGMSADERQAWRERMRNATTPEERQKLALEHRNAMQAQGDGGAHRHGAGHGPMHGAAR